MRMSLLQRAIALAVLVCVAVPQGCARLEEAGLWKEPRVAFSDARIVGLNFDAVRLELDMTVTNPNSFNIAYGALEYAAEVEKARLFSGRMSSGGTLKAGGQTKLTLPLNFTFAELVSSVKNFKSGAGYVLQGAMLFQAPLVGEVRVPVKTQGVIPTLERPGISLAGLATRNFGINGADLLLSLQVENPNAFEVILQGFNYALQLNGRQVASGASVQSSSWQAGKSGVLEVPIRLSFLEGGRFIHDLLRNNSKLDYQLDFRSSLSGAVPGLSGLSFQTSRRGAVGVDRR